MRSICIDVKERPSICYMESYNGVYSPGDNTILKTKYSKGKLVACKKIKAIYIWRIQILIKDCYTLVCMQVYRKIRNYKVNYRNKEAGSKSNKIKRYHWKTIAVKLTWYTVFRVFFSDENSWFQDVRFTCFGIFVQFSLSSGLTIWIL